MRRTQHIIIGQNVFNNSYVQLDMVNNKKTSQLRILQGFEEDCEDVQGRRRNGCHWRRCQAAVQQFHGSYHEV